MKTDWKPGDSFRIDMEPKFSGTGYITEISERIVKAMEVWHFTAEFDGLRHLTHLRSDFERDAKPITEDVCQSK